MLIKLITILKEIYKEKPKRIKKIGSPKKYSENQISMIFIVMQFKKIKSYNGIIRFLKANKKICSIIGIDKIPHRTTLSRRAVKVNKKLREIIQRLGDYYCSMMKDEILFAAEDSTSLKSKGPLWHKKYRRQGIIPYNLRGVDKDSKWGFSTSKGFYQGYKLHLNAVFDKNNELIPFPVDAVLTTANVSDNKKARTIYRYLKENVKVQFADSGYDDNLFFLELLKTKGILFISSLKGKVNDPIRKFRSILLKWIQSIGYKYTRNTTIEPLNGRLKDNFQIDPLPVKGKSKVQTWVLAAVICYQLILIYNLKMKRKMGAVKEILELI
jgi:hypothetical protein